MRVAAAGVCHSDVHLADGDLGDGRWPTVLGHEGAGVVEAVGAGVDGGLAPGDRVAFCFVPPCRACAACARGPAQPLRDRRRSTRGRARCWTARRACASPTAARCSTSSSSRASRSTASFRPRARCRSRPSCRCGRPRCSAARVVTGFGAVRNAARVEIGESVCVVGCGGIGLQMVAGGPAWPARAASSRSTATGRSSSSRARRGATDTVDASAGDPVAGGARARARRGRPRVRGGRPSGDDPAGLGRAAPRRDGDRGRHRAARRRGRACLRSTCSPRSRCGAATTARATRAAEIARLARLMAAGRITVADAVSHLTDLEGIEAAFERLRARQRRADGRRHRRGAGRRAGAHGRGRG